MCLSPYNVKNLTNEQSTLIQHFTIATVGMCGLLIESLLQLDHHIEDRQQFCKLLTVLKIIYFYVQYHFLYATVTF